MITYHVGDATQPDLEGNVTIAHILSDSPKGHYDAGFAKNLAEVHPAARYRFQLWAKGLEGSGTQRPFKLGALQFVGVGHDLGATHRWNDRWVANMVAQHGLRSPTNPHPLDLDALDQCLRFLAEWTRGPIAMPRIGCNLAGGTWEEVGPIVEATLADHDVHVYDLDDGALVGART